MDICPVLGRKLAELTGQYEVGCVALIKLSVQDAGKDPARLSYVEMRDVLQVNLLRRLERLKVPNPPQVTAKLLSVLREQQSLFTLSAH
jgi:hypothetical protein